MKKSSLLEILLKKFPDTKRVILYSRIMCGEVLVNGEKNYNPSSKVFIDARIEIIEKKFVSRGGLKLEAALDRWNIITNKKIFLDAGSSTGGFTDCLLKRGAGGVHAVDVGYNQLAYVLRTDKRVSVYEKCNIMHLNELTPVPDAAVADLSFRSISGAARHIIDLTSEKWLIALVKPQFEMDLLKYPDFNGVIGDKNILHNVLNGVLKKIGKDKLFVEKVMLSPIKGRKGNTEFLFLIRDNQTNDANPLWMEQVGQELDDLIDMIPTVPKTS